jgi:hypothetical protein
MFKVLKLSLRLCFKFRVLVFLEGGQTNLHQNIVGFRVRREWGVGGLKSKWRRLMKHFDSTKEKHNHLFRVTTL